MNAEPYFRAGVRQVRVGRDRNADVVAHPADIHDCLVGMFFKEDAAQHRHHNPARITKYFYCATIVAWPAVASWSTQCGTMLRRSAATRPIISPACCAPNQ